MYVLQGRRQDFFQGGSEGYILDFPGGGVGDQILAHLYGQNKKIVKPRGVSRPPLPTPLMCSADVTTTDAQQVYV